MKGSAVSEIEQVARPKFDEAAPAPGGSRSGTLPRLPRTVIDRRGLNDALNAGLGDEVTIVRAPAGYGKTIGVAAWVVSHPRFAPDGVAWMELDAPSPNSAGFWTDLLDEVTALAGAASSAGNCDTAARAADVLAAIPHTAIVVLDGYTPAWDAAIGEGLVRLVKRAPNVHLVVLSRTRTSFESTQLSTRMDVHVVDESTLRFDDTEIHELARSEGLDTRSVPFKRIARITGRWPLFVKAILRALKRSRSSWAVELLDMTIADIADDMLSALRGRCTRDEWEAILLSARLPYLSEGLIGHIAPDSDARALLEKIEDAGIGLWSHHNGRANYLVAEPVLGALQAIALNELSRDGIDVDRLTEMLEAHGDAPEALRQALVAGRTELAESLTRRYISELYSTRSAAFRHAFGAVSRHELGGSILLLTVAGLLVESEPHGPARARAMYQAALDAPSGRVDTAHQAWADAALMVASRKCGRFAQADQHRSKLATALGACGKVEPAVVLAHLEMGMTSMRRGQDRDALNSLRQVEDTAQGEPRIRYAALGLRALVHAVRGEIDLAGDLCSQADATCDSTLVGNDLIAAPYLIARSIVGIESGTAREAEYRPAAGELSAYAVFSRAVGAIQSADLPTAHLELDSQAQTEASLPASNIENARLISLRADLLIAEGSLLRAQQLLTAFPDGTNALLPVRTRLALMQQNYRQAHAIAERVAWDAEAPRARAEMLLVQACAAKRLGMRRAAETAFLRAVKLASTHKLHVPFTLTIAEDLFEMAGELLPENTGLLSGTPMFSDTTMAAKLTQRERVVLEHLDSKLSLDEIAKALVVSVNTVKTQTRSIYRKLGVASRKEAVRAAHDLGLLRLLPNQAARAHSHSNQIA